jgi:hypothetical protein
MRKKAQSFSGSASEKENSNIPHSLSLGDISCYIQLEEKQEDVIFPSNTPPKKHINNKILLLTSTILGAGVGLAMMPIFNEEVEHLENYGINVHGNTTFFAISTINTLIVMGFCSAFAMYKYLSSAKQGKPKDFSQEQKLALKLIETGCVLKALVPVGLLWDIELNNQEVQGTNGFDQFIAWATFTSLPLIIFNSLNNFKQIDKFIANKSENIELNTFGSKLVTYGISFTSLIGRGVSFTYILDNFFTQLGFKQTTSLPVAIITSGVIGNVIGGLNEYSQLKKLFKVTDNNISYRELALGTLAALEGAWFTLPLISEGLNNTKDWNPLLKGAIFSSFFLSHTNLEASHIYHSLLPQHQQEEQYDEVQLSGETGELI